MARLGATARLLSGVLAAVPAVAAPFAHAACLQVTLRGRQDAEGTQRSSFAAGEAFVVCIGLGQDAFVSIWDAPPRGADERLYPNRFSHPDSAENLERILGGKLDGGRVHCFGGPGTAPMFMDKRDGIGGGRLSVTATIRVEDQVQPEVAQIPGARRLRAIIPEAARTFQKGVACSGKMIEVVDYAVRG